MCKCTNNRLRSGKERPYVPNNVCVLAASKLTAGSWLSLESASCYHRKHSLQTYIQMYIDRRPEYFRVKHSKLEWAMKRLREAF